jgi:hypothetical protein
MTKPLSARLAASSDQGQQSKDVGLVSARNTQVDLVIVDEAERLTNMPLEHLRDPVDRAEIGLILLGGLDFEKRMSPDPPLSRNERGFIATEHWQTHEKSGGAAASTPVIGAANARAEFTAIDREASRFDWAQKRDKSGMD